MLNKTQINLELSNKCLTQFEELTNLENGKIKSSSRLIPQGAGLSYSAASFVKIPKQLTFLN